MNPTTKSLGWFTTLKKSLVVSPKPKPSIIRAKAIGAIFVTTSMIIVNLNYFLQLDIKNIAIYNHNK